MSTSQKIRHYHNRFLNALLIVFILLMTVYAGRKFFIRSIAATRIYSKNIFVAADRRVGESALVRMWYDIQFYYDIAGFKIDQKRRVKRTGLTLKPLVKELNRRQSAGELMQYSMNQYREIRWLLNFTSDTALTSIKIREFGKHLNDSLIQKTALEQQGSDGSWGAGLNAWHLRMYYSLDYMQDGMTHRYPYSFLDRINSPALLKNHLDSLLNNDFTRTGKLNRAELDNTFSALARLLSPYKKIDYNFHPGLDSTLRNFVDHWQDKTTGCWGQWLLDRHGRLWKMDDMAITFHVVSDLHGEVNHLELIAKRLIQLSEADFPTGIRYDGIYNNHLNWDAVRIFRYSWPHLDTVTRAVASKKISEMVGWCLKESLQPDGSFRLDEIDDTPGDAFTYGVAFLDEAGFFDPGKKFWTTREFPESQRVRDKIRSKILSAGKIDSGFREALDILDGKAY